MTTHYVDFISGSDAANGLSFANRKKTLASVSPSANDDIRVMMSPAPSSIGSWIWNNNSDSIQYDSGTVIENIDTCDSASGWLNGSGSLTTSTSIYRQGTASVKSTITSSTPSSIIFYKDLGLFPLAPNLTNCSYICFWLYYDNAAFDPTTLYLTLTNSGGSVLFNNICPTTFPTNVWMPIVIAGDFSSPDYVELTSFQLQGTMPASSTNLYIDNIVATENIHFNCFISKNTGSEPWLAIRSINAASAPIIIKLDTSGRFSPSTTATYQGTTETVTTYVREGIRPTPSNSTYQTASYTGPVSISGGWDTTDMSSQIGDTFTDGRTGNGTGLSLAGDSISFDKYYIRRFNVGGDIGTTNFSGSIGSSNCFDDALLFSGNNLNLNTIYDAFGSTNGVDCTLTGTASAQNIYNADCAQDSGVKINGPKNFNLSGTLEARGSSTYNLRMATGGGTLNRVITHRSATVGSLFITTQPLFINTFSASFNGTYGAQVSTSSPIKIYNSSTGGNTNNASFLLQSDGLPKNVLIENALFADTTLATSFPNYAAHTLKVQKEHGNYDVNKTTTDGFIIKSNTTDRHTASGFAWELDITSSIRNIQYPGKFLLGPVALNANGTFTFKIWAKKSHASNISSRLIVYGGRIPGILNDVSTEITATSYTQYTLTGIIPTERCSVEVWCEVWSNTGSTTDYVLLDDIDLSQT